MTQVPRLVSRTMPQTDKNRIARIHRMYIGDLHMLNLRSVDRLNGNGRTVGILYPDAINLYILESTE